MFLHDTIDIEFFIDENAYQFDSSYHERLLDSILLVSRSQNDFYAAVRSNHLPSHLQLCIHYKRMSYSEPRSRSTVSAPQRARSYHKVSCV
jgi:hypothetical protein